MFEQKAQTKKNDGKKFIKKREIRDIVKIVLPSFLLLLHVTVPWGCKIHPLSLWPETNQKVGKKELK